MDGLSGLCGCFSCKWLFTLGRDSRTGRQAPLIRGRFGFGGRRAGWNDLNDLEPFLLEFIEKFRKGRNSTFVNIMEKQYSAPLRFQF